MTTWILTTGNSDVILKHDDNWGNLYSEIMSDCPGFSSPIKIDPYDSSAGYTIAARVLGLAYQNQPDYFLDLKFPLLDTYKEYFTNNEIKLEKIIILLTDQSQIFDEDARCYERCPYWQDTSTLQPLLESYCKDNFTCQPEFAYLKPDKFGQGIDHWNGTLTLVEEILRQLDIDLKETVYVSHQAGTPAISSAAQFVTLGRCKEVKFLVSNQYFDENQEQVSNAEAIQSSSYWRGIQIQKAKQLIVKGLPVAAKEILTGIVDDQTIKQLNDIIDLFNIKNSSNKGQEFEIEAATKRIITGLDLIEIFFKQENYIQGIAILNACQETFLKTAILSQTSKINPQSSNIVDWHRTGLSIQRHNGMQNTLEILQKLKFPCPNNGDFDLSSWDKFSNQSNKYFKLNNSRQFQWLLALKKEFKPWNILSWSCEYRRDSEDDLRNQLLHNLLGVEKQEVLEYLLGYNRDSLRHFAENTNAVNQAYLESVKQPFLKGLRFFGLCQEQVIENKLEKNLQEIANSLESHFAPAVHTK